MIRTAFVLGAGLGKRLRPLTAERPKPLVPVRNRPLITHVFDALIAAGIQRFVVNTHHCAAAYGEAFPDRAYRDREIVLVHEPVLLETAGGIANAREHFRGEPVLVHNGDVLANLNLPGLLAAHAEGGAEVTALVRSKDGPLQVLFDRRSRRIKDFRGALGATGGILTLFTGAYVIEPVFVDRIPRDEILSVVPVFVDLLRAGVPIAGRLDDAGNWADLGDRVSYLAAHADGWVIDPAAEVGRDVDLRGFGAIGPGARIGDGATLENTVIWGGAEIASGADLRGCIVRDRRVAAGTHEQTDF